MSLSFLGLEDLYKINAIPTLVLSLGLLGLIGILLTLGRRLDSAMKLERFGIPIALLIGALGFLIGPYGPLSLLPERVLNTWMQLPTPLLTLVFATLMLGRPIPRISALWKPVASQALLGLLLGFGQYVVGGIIVLSFLLPYLGVDPLMGCIIEVGFEGGHGAAAIMGDSFMKLGFPEGLDLGFAMATVGLLASTLLGSGLVVLGRFFGWLVPAEQEIQNDSTESVTNPIENEESESNTFNSSNGLENFKIDEEDTPELFNSDNPEENNENTFSSIEANENNKEEDDLEIPAFLRRQKN